MKQVAITEHNFLDVLNIYNVGLKTGEATFETELPSWEEWDVAHLPFGRIAITDRNKMIGWAALSSVSKRKVYSGVAEVSLYVTENSRGKSIGTQLLKALITESEAHNIWTLQASVMNSNIASIKLHLKCGFRKIGYREKIGRLNRKWLDNIIFERRSRITGI